MTSSPVKRIGILAHAGTDNLGDEAIVGAAIENVRRRYPHGEILGFTIHPENTEQLHKIRAFPIRREPGSDGSRNAENEREARRSGWLRSRLKQVPVIHHALKWLRDRASDVRGVGQEIRFLFESRRRLQKTDLLLIVGSQQLNDYFGGPWGFPYTLLKWVILARSTGTNVALLSVGAGPIRARLSLVFIRGVLSCLQHYSFRDVSSPALLQSLGVAVDHRVVPDLAYSLVLPTSSRVPSKGLQVGLNPVPYFDSRYWPEADAHVYDLYVQKTADFALWLMKRGHSIVFFPTQLRADPPVIEDIRSAIARMNADVMDRQVIVPEVRSPADLLSAIGMN